MSSRDDFRVEYLEGIKEMIAWPAQSPLSFEHRVLVTGGRAYSSPDLLYRALSEYAAKHPVSELAAWCATGVDTYALDWAEECGVPRRKYVADWDRYGDAAGSRRNIVMLEHFQPHIVIGFVGNTGTLHCLRQARKRGIERKLIEHGPDDWGLDMGTWG